MHSRRGGVERGPGLDVGQLGHEAATVAAVLLITSCCTSAVWATSGVVASVASDTGC
ncbi:hypothetical protein [Dictyobacter kobayashii]|uniref:hypothetical protein n=1 Tax=Dictyobacter kobayashii TaxID=2014872 RepID=UPI0013867A58|nr:hypothetical protein [Dictyobacter kobayashii]